MALYKTIDDITRTKTSLDGSERLPARDSLGDFKITVDNIKASIISSPVYSTDENYVVLDDDNYSRIEVDTTSGDITITLPLKANNLAREIEIANVKGGTNKVIIATNAGDATTLSNDGLATMWLPKVGDFVKFRESQTSGCWEVVNERITSQLRLDTYAGFGSTDNKIMRFTNIIENVGNMFSENHVSGYSGNSKGLEITINRSGRYSVFGYFFTPANKAFGISIDSNQLTTSIITITKEHKATIFYPPAASYSPYSVNRYFIKNQIIRVHCLDNTASPTPVDNNICVSYLGN